MLPKKRKEKKVEKIQIPSKSDKERTVLYMKTCTHF